jgi:hypothetical protein
VLDEVGSGCSDPSPPAEQPKDQAKSAVAIHEAR